MSSVLVSYESIDGNGEVEQEFDSIIAATLFIDKQEGLLTWWSISNEHGDVVKSS